MQYLYGTTEVRQTKDSVVVLGNFDGIHRGHQALFNKAKEAARKYGLQTIVFSFYPHPSWVIGTHPKPLLMSRRNKKKMTEQMKMDVLIEYPFTQAFAAIAPETFFTEVLIKKLKAKVLVVGSNYYFGHEKAGNPAYLQKLGEKYDIQVCVVDAVTQGGNMISSTTIRNYISAGEIEAANEMLGHPYTVVGNVVQGKRLGRTIGFPTINLIADPDSVYPPNGVYATYVKVYNTLYMGMTNIGYNPTVNGERKMIETHLFDYNKELYGAEVEIYFYHHMRCEQKFENIDALKMQIEKDKEGVKLFFKKQTNLIAK